MTQDIRLGNGIVPTVLSFDEDSGDYIIGEEAKKGGVSGVTNIFNFKNRIGSPDSNYTAKVDLWIAPKGKKEGVLTFNTHDAAKKYLEILLNKYQIPDQVYIGIPSTTNSSWAENYKIHIRKLLEELGYPDPKFYYEPFAVFQSFKHKNKSLDFKGKSLLIIDIGGSTFNTCIVRSTTEGKITMGASASGVPLGVHSEHTGGVYVDEKLSIHWAKTGNAMPKEPPENILSRPNRSAYLYAIEKAKIDLSKKFNLKKKVTLPEKSLAVDFDRESLLSIDFPNSRKSLSIDDLHATVRSIISEKWIPQLHKTIEEAKAALKKSNIELKEIDYVVLAGGSSQLPRLEEELIKALAHIIPDKKKLFRLEDDGHSVAEGLAITAKEESSKNPRLISSRNARCLTGDLFLGVKLSRADPYEFPQILSVPGADNGSVISGPLEIVDEEVVVDLELPFIPKGRVIFGFFNKKSDADDNYILNSGSETHNIDQEDKFTKTAKLFIKFPREDYISTRIEFFSKKKNKNISFRIGDFSIDRSNIITGSKFIGIDFGNSNSYVVEYISPTTITSEFSYPEFNISNSSKVALEEIEKKFNDIVRSGMLTKEKSIDISEKNIIQAVYHSNKIEGNVLTFGQTTQVFNSDSVSLASKDEIEVKNLAECYRWVIENHASFYENPILYIRSVNQMIMDKIKTDNGSYRTFPVEIAGAEFTPPEHYKIPQFMEMLAAEIQKGHSDRSFLEFACSIHTKFVYIHPFSDGNGRTARLLIDTILLNAGCQSLIIKSDERTRYLEALLLSNRGDISELISHYADTLKSAMVAIENDHNAQQARNNHLSYNNIYEEIDSSENPLFDVLRKVTSRKAHRWIELFEGFYSECNSLVMSLYSIIDELRRHELLADVVTLTCESMGEMSDQAFSEIIKSKDNKYYWYYSFSVRQEHGANLTYLLAFKYDSDSDCGMSLYLGRREESFGQLLTSPIRIRKFLYKEGRLVAINHDGSVNRKEYKDLMLGLIAELVEFYILN